MRFISLLMIFTTSLLYSQISNVQQTTEIYSQISNVQQTTENGRIIITYNLIGYMGGIYNIKVTATNEDGKTIEPRGIVGDLHEIKNVNEKSIWWETSIDGVNAAGWKINLTAENLNAPKRNSLSIKCVLVQGWPGGDYYISVAEITFDQYDAFCDETGYQKPKDSFGRGQQPVVNVNVADAVAYCNWLSKKTGTIVRLPEEGEWEYAAKGGNRSKGYAYSGSNDINEVAWYDGNSESKSHEVATKRPNELGIYDMSGNVWEWCGTSGVIRGGSWASKNDHCLVSYRDDQNIDQGYSGLGFRILQKK